MRATRTVTTVVALFALSCVITAGPLPAKAADQIFACVNRHGAIHIAEAESCGPHKTLFVFAGADQVVALQQTLATLQGQVAALHRALARANATLACLEMAPTGTDLIVKGCNLHLQSGGGATSAEVNGLGNLIIGYNEADFGTEVRTGSHNLVIGRGHTYTSFGGLLAGTANRVTGPAGSVTGGRENTSAGLNTSVSGGTRNTAFGFNTSVSGGSVNTAEGEATSVSGGNGNNARGFAASVSGGFGNIARDLGSVSGGAGNVADNQGSVSGGSGNAALSQNSSVSGGFRNAAMGDNASVSGGANRSTTERFNWAAGSLFEPN